jgi:hypothetical protein
MMNDNMKAKEALPRRDWVDTALLVAGGLFFLLSAVALGLAWLW